MTDVPPSGLLERMQWPSAEHVPPLAHWIDEVQSAVHIPLLQ